MKDPYTYTNDYGDTEEIPLEDIEKCHNDKKFQKIMEILLHDEKEKYLNSIKKEKNQKNCLNTSMLKQLSHKKMKLKPPSYKNISMPCKRNVFKY